MNSILVRSTPAQPTAAGRILAIEPDTERAGVLRDTLRDYTAVELTIVSRTEDGLRSIAAQVPDLVITSTFLPPAEEAELSAQVRRLPHASHVQIIGVPYFVDAEPGSPQESRSSNVLRFLRRPRPTIRPRCDTATRCRQIQEYLDQAVARRRAREESAAIVVEADEKRPDVCRTPASTATIVAAGFGRTCMRSDPADRRRANRRRGEELPFLWTVRLPWGSDVKVVDISNRGVLLESASKISPGSTLDLRLLGEDTNLFVPARMVRAEVASVDTLGVKYRIGAAFSRELDLAGLEPAADSPPSAHTLLDLLTRVLKSGDAPTGSAALRARLEAELRHVLRLRDVLIRETPLIGEKGAESIYFTLPGPSSSPRILQGDLRARIHPVSGGVPIAEGGRRPGRRRARPRRADGRLPGTASRAAGLSGGQGDPITAPAVPRAASSSVLSTSTTRRRWSRAQRWRRRQAYSWRA
jgi:hypothetical protein